MVMEGEGPFVLSLVLDGSVDRIFCQSQWDIKKSLREWGIEANEVLTEFENVVQRGGTLTVISPIIYTSSGVRQECRLIIEQIVAGMTVVIFGAGHVGKAVAEVSVQMGWSIIVIDDRPEFLDQIDGAAGKVRKIAQEFEAAADGLALTRNSAMVIVTRGHQFDEVCLEACLKTDAFYIGMIGSRRRVRTILSELKKKGTLARKVDEVHAPIGLEIGARTPQEIAVSIVAEIIKEKSLIGNMEPDKMRMGLET